MDTPPADFRPFRAWRYDPKRVSLKQVIAPPYDVISGKEQDALYERSPYNVVRLILGKESDFYEEARKRWEAWSRQGILIQDKTPSFYLYEQVFSHPVEGREKRRVAVCGILKLEEPGAVFRHESTFEGPKRDRLSLLEKVRTNLSPVFGLYQDSKKIVRELAEDYRNEVPLFEARDDQEVLHRGWAVEKKEEQAAIHRALESGRIVIADGHHRYETALEYRKQMRQKIRTAPVEAPYDFVLMALVETQDEGLAILPTHRVIRSFGETPRDRFVEALKRYFDFTPVSPAQLVESLEAQPSEEAVLGFCFEQGGSFILRLKDELAVRSQLPQEKPAIWYRLDANLLTSLIFDQLWGLPPEKRGGFIEYTHFPEEALRAVQTGRARAAFFLRAPKVDRVQELAYAGERLPQKTTYFFPKLASGLFFYRHE